MSTDKPERVFNDPPEFATMSYREQWKYVVRKFLTKNDGSVNFINSLLYCAGWFAAGILIGWVVLSVAS